MLDTLAFWIYLPMLALPPLGLLFDAPVYYLVSGLAAVLYIQRFLWFLVPRGPRRAEGQPVLRLVTANLLKFNQASDAMVAALRATDADVIALQELQPEHARAIAANMAESHPHQLLYPGDDAEGIGLISRYPFLSARLLQSCPEANPTQLVALQVGARRFWIVHAHTRIPEPTFGPMLGLWLPNGLDTGPRRQDIEEIVALAERLEGEALILGDLNITPEEADYRLIPTHWRNAFRSVGHGPGFTYPVRVLFFGVYVPFPLFRIDHVFCRGAWRILRARTGPIPGSDHRYLAVELSWPRR
ncbi:MAG: endonuclease/exonuclease/phosphatase family protein [Anaerolineae bacterium]|nr:endonuclease/exonuclease/phosphatase family protein [Anaerolineae bacterium]